MAMSESIAKLTMDRASTDSIRNEAISQGMRLLIDDGIEKAKEGLTTIEEVLSVATVYGNVADLV